MKPSGPNPYLKTRVLTASREELRLMLYDGAIRFANQARAALDRRDFEAGHEALVRAQRIVLELSSSLKHELAPELCGKLAALYTYIYRQLVAANVEHKHQPLDEALKLLEFERETWQMLMANSGGDAPPPQGTDQPAPLARSA